MYLLHLFFWYKWSIILNKNLKRGRRGEISRRCFSSPLVLRSGYVQSALSLPTEADGNWPASSQCYIRCYLVGSFLLRGKTEQQREQLWLKEGGRKQDSFKCWTALDFKNPLVLHRPILISCHYRGQFFQEVLMSKPRRIFIWTDCCLSAK